MKTKIKIMETRPGLTDDEIRSEMNFEGLLKQRNDVIAGRRRTLTRGITGGVIALVIVMVSILFFYQDPNPSSAPMTSDTTAVTPAAKQDEVIVVDPRSTASAQEGEKPPVKKQKDTTASSEPVAEKKENTSDVEKTASELTEPVYIQAEPREGYSKLYEYFGQELHYPESAVKDSIQGVVTIMFTINPAGNPEHIAIRNSLGKAFDDEAIRLIEHMPAWNAATLNGKPVASKISIPLTFQVRKIKTN